MTEEPSIRLDVKRIPSTIKEAAEILADSYNDAAKEDIRNAPLCFRRCNFADSHVVEIDGLIHYYPGYQVSSCIRNSWGLWNRESDVHQDAVKTYGIAHGDDLSSLIFAWSYAIVRGDHFDPVNYCNIFHAHWSHSGKTSLEAGGC